VKPTEEKVKERKKEGTNGREGGRRRTSPSCLVLGDLRHVVGRDRIKTAELQEGREKNKMRPTVGVRPAAGPWKGRTGDPSSWTKGKRGNAKN